jgi:transglutaminase-like putative cysteine protease
MKMNNKKKLVFNLLFNLLSICLLFSVIMLILTNFTQDTGFDDSNLEKDIIDYEFCTMELFSEYEKGDSLKKYLISTKNAPSDEKYIKDLSKQITENHNTSLSKAEAIFDWVKKNISYFRYSDTNYGGEETLQKRVGNCVDTSHALVSLFRAEGIPARYVSGECEFTEGDLAGITVSHVWVQVLINNEWVVADGIYEKNKLGYVCNWNTSSYKLYKIYPNI